MTKNIHEVLSPLLIISYVCGLKVAQFPAGDPKKWFSILYMLLLWSLYNFILIYKVMPYTTRYSIIYYVGFGINAFTALLSIAVGIHREKTLKNCIKKLTIVDDTLDKLGITTDYRKLRMRVVWTLLAWFIIAILMNYVETRFLRDQYNYSIAKAIYIPLICNYYFHINLIGNMIITNILRYIGLKFDQINEHIEKLATGNKRKIQKVWEHSILLSRQSRFLEVPNSEWMIWIVMHLYSELHKISREVDSIFGTQMTLEMLCYFSIIAASFQEMCNIIFVSNYVDIASNKTLYTIGNLFWVFIYIFKLTLINYTYERVSTKASVIRNSISGLSYSNCNIKVRENILQLLLQMLQSPFRFYGLGFFQFGFKFLYWFSTSIATCIVIIIQLYTTK